MKALVRGLAVVLCAAALVLGPATAASAKSYHFSNVDIAIAVRADGSFTVRETRTFAFSGTYHFAFIDIPQGSYRIDGVGVSENGGAYRQVESEGAQTPGTFVFSDSGEYEIRWFYAQTDGSRTFTISYVVHDAIVRYDDVAELYWKFVGDQWDVGTDEARATVTLPAGATRDQVKAWGHGPLEGEVHIVDPTTIVWSTPTLPARTFMEGRLEFPPSLVPGAPRVTGAHLPGVLAEETRLANEANSARTRARVWNIATPLVALLSLGFFMWLFLRWGKEPPAPDPGEYVREPPADYPPAVLGYLLRFGSVKPADMTATLIDLARKRYLEIREIPEEVGLLIKHERYRYAITIRKAPDDSLTAYEREVLDLLQTAATGDTITDEELKDWAKKHAADMHKRFQMFSVGVKQEGRLLGLVDSRWAIIGANVVVGAIVALLAFAGLSAQGGGGSALKFAPGPVIALVLVAVQLAGSPLLRRRSKKGAADYRDWMAFKHFLKDFSRVQEWRPASV
ncbi:MAG: DUF2207 domain-containing protein, partial [Actinomycetota bacterium]